MGDRDYERARESFKEWVLEYHPEVIEKYNINESDLDEISDLSERIMMDLSRYSPSFNQVQNYPLYTELIEYIDFQKQTSNKKDIWYEIYDTLIDLKNSNNLNTDIILIDHFLDMQHHSGHILERVLGKDPLEIPDEDTAAIKHMLDIKSSITSLEEFLPLISTSLKTFAYKVIYNLTGKTQEMLSE